jgi:hypothetical protein
MSIVLDMTEDHAQSQLLMLTALDFGFLYHRVQSLNTSQFFHPILFNNAGEYTDLKKEYNSVRRRSFPAFSMGLLHA